MHFVMTLIFLGFSAFSQLPPADKDPLTEALAQEFMQITGAPVELYSPIQTMQSPLEYTTLPSPKPGQKRVIGRCWPLSLLGPGYRIEYDVTYWRETTENWQHGSQWALVMHEMAHCVCGLGHASEPSGWATDFVRWLNKIGIKTNRGDLLGLYPDGCPKTVMTPHSPGNYCVNAHKIDYARDLKERCERNIKFMRFLGLIN
jgi:hypothetical protein